MTDLLYLSDPYQKEFEAAVCEVAGQEVSLDRTAFYPGGGGQPCDHGQITLGSRVWNVARVRKQGSEVWHELDGTPPGQGERIQASLDWPRRYHLMRTHTAMHILCGVIFRDYSACVTGGNMEPLKGRMDFEFETMRQELVREIEGKINAEVAAARPVSTRILPREEAYEIPDLIRTKINLLPPDIQQVRVVEIAGLDLQADGGTHVANTREVGGIRVVDYKSKGKINKRIEVEIEEP